MNRVTRAQAKKLIGREIYAVRKDGTVVSGKLVSVQGDTLHLSLAAGRKKARTKAIIPLVLFDLLAIGTAPYAGFYGGYPYGGYYGGGFGGFWW